MTHTELAFKLYIAACHGNDEEVGNILLESPGVDVNWSNHNEQNKTPLHGACKKGHSAIVSMLLAHPNIKVNKTTIYGETPLMRACQNGNFLCTWMLLEDPRVDTTFPDMYGLSPFYYAATRGHVDIIKLYIASGRDLGWGKDNTNGSHTIFASESLGRTEIVSILQDFICHPEKTRNKMKVEIGWTDTHAKLFALIVFLSDNLLTITTTNATTTTTGASRFFNITNALPMELQMIICHRVTGSMKKNITINESEAAFRWLAKYYSLT